MPKIGMEPLRKDALIRAAIVEVGTMGSLDVTVGQHISTIMEGSHMISRSSV